MAADVSSPNIRAYGEQSRTSSGYMSQFSQDRRYYNYNNSIRIEKDRRNPYLNQSKTSSNQDYFMMEDQTQEFDNHFNNRFFIDENQSGVSQSRTSSGFGAGIAQYPLHVDPNYLDLRTGSQNSQMTSISDHQRTVFKAWKKPTNMIIKH